MGRRSDHSRAELREIIISEGHRQMQEVGFARFSAREVAKRIGYSIGTVYNVFGSHDGLILAINGRTLELWLGYLEARLNLVEPGGDRLARAIDAYFEFAIANRHAWAALYDFRLPNDVEPPDHYRERVAAIVAAVEREVAAVLAAPRKSEALKLTRSLLATVHGHCFFALNGTFRMLGETDPLAAARARVDDALEGYR
ncbi:MAG: TetR/AcrR family transcriptional regulator [Rhizobiales bacterium]|nr:TetR/AcrR family transcriptional regulator [Hyphomicrobiales bacterium]